MLSIRPSGYCISEAVRGMRPSSWARGSGTWTKPVNPVSMTASTDVDGPDGAEMAIVTTGLRLLSSDPRIVAIRQATRPERRSIAGDESGGRSPRHDVSQTRPDGLLVNNSPGTFRH